MQNGSSLAIFSFLDLGVSGILSDFVVKTNGREHAYKDGDYNVMGNKY